MEVVISAQKAREPQKMVPRNTKEALLVKIRRRQQVGTFQGHQLDQCSSYRLSNDVGHGKYFGRSDYLLWWTVQIIQSMLKEGALRFR